MMRKAEKIHTLLELLRVEGLLKLKERGNSKVDAKHIGNKS